MTKKKEQSVKKAWDRPAGEAARRGEVDVDEKKQVLRQIAQYRRSFGGELTSTKKLSLATPLDELKEEYEEIQRELSTRARLGMALVQTVLAVHAANANRR
eukprot:tig00021017_g17230.t1